MKTISENDKECDYVKDLLNGKGIIGELPDGSVIQDSIIQTVHAGIVLIEFVHRYNNNKITLKYKYEDYIKDQQLQATINGLKMDADSFWLLIVFAYDYAISRCLDTCKFAKLTKNDINDFLDLFLTVFDVDEKNRLLIKDNVSLTIKQGKSSYTLTNKYALAAIYSWCNKGFEKEKENLKNPDINDIYLPHDESDSFLLTFFAQILLYFFELHKEFKGRAKKGANSTLSKYILISNLIYHTRLSKNNAFLNDSETLKGYLKQYKNKKVVAHGNYYT